MFGEGEGEVVVNVGFGQDIMVLKYARECGFVVWKPVSVE